ncbi:hypothetical protein MCOR27_009771 [Pyricularia oryzae]|uniref:DUF6594 domain-containing protein n=2 Tax=Pyricularia TaxID=48558 RepID=A0ABQ8P1D4_PYRGI|nr:hypothetical protein MCOR01_010193 [Pyricularia oryzae]KAI6304055.1 hypothetical protein MCOR33_000801 [Pyricularia grisea]KAI6255370.1 hypothetical protein MCOR19_008125 [Pyricularia oryzae]KAI6269331.1 hypothetical protein MCOR26_008763 [Pyricularia oryzae]KAI6269360.1 hypothetical protein MCOR27_009771 [Pyricularia oryzae]
MDSANTTRSTLGDIMSEAGAEQQDVLGAFRKHWQVATADSNLTLHGFRRFKTAHLLNLRFIEDEISRLDHNIYQTALSMKIESLGTDRLGLNSCKQDSNLPSPETIVNRDMVVKLRDLLQRYDDALISFNQIMAMETFSLIDDEKQSRLRTELTLEEIYKTRLLRADLDPRSHTDPFQRQIHKWLRAFHFKRQSNNADGKTESPRPHPKKSPIYRNSILISEIFGRVVTILVTILFLILPLALLSQEADERKQLIIVSVFILFFALIVAMALKMPSYQIMAVCAAYAAVLSTFVS